MNTFKLALISAVAGVVAFAQAAPFVIGTYDFEGAGTEYQATNVLAGVTMSDITVWSGAAGTIPPVQTSGSETAITTAFLEIGGDATESGTSTALSNNKYLSFTISNNTGDTLLLSGLNLIVGGHNLWNYSNCRILSDVQGFDSVVDDTIGTVGYGTGSFSNGDTITSAVHTVEFRDDGQAGRGGNINDADFDIADGGSITFYMPWVDGSTSASRYVELDDITVTAVSEVPVDLEYTFTNVSGQDITTAANWSPELPTFGVASNVLWSIDGTTSYGAAQGATTLLLNSGLIVGSTNAATGDLTITGGTLMAAGGEDAIIADTRSGNSSGTLTVSGGSFIVDGNLAMHRKGDTDASSTSVLNVQGGTVVVSNDLKVARETSSAATATTADINVSDGSLFIDGRLPVGRAADNLSFTMNLSGGATTINNGGASSAELWADGGTAVINITGSAVFTNHIFRTRESGTMAINLGGGATLVNRTFLNQGAGSLTLNLNGGTLIGRTSGDFIRSSVNAYVYNDSTIDTAGFDLQINGPMVSGGGALTITGGGLFRVFNTNAYTGGTTVDDGVTLGGDGHLSANVVLAADDCGLAPGPTSNPYIGTLSFGADLDISAMAATSNALSWQLSGDASDKIVVAGDLDIGVGQLDISSFLFDNNGVTQGQKIVVFEAGSITGSLGSEDTGPLDDIGAEGMLSIEGGTNLLLTVTAESDESKVAEWLRDHGLEVGTENEDPDGDGVDNLSEYAFDGDPTNAAVTGVLPEYGFAEVSGTNYFISVHQERTGNDRGIDYNILTTPDLVNEAQTNGNYEMLGASIPENFRAFYTNGIPLDSGDVYFLNVEIEKW